MSGADAVLYSQVTFTRAGENNNTSSSAETTYAEVKISTTQPSSELPPASQQQAESTRRWKVTRRRAAVAAFCVLLAATVIALGVTFYKMMEFPQKLTNEHEIVKETVTGDWELHGAQCYYFSKDKSTWTGSRAQCRAGGGDLVKIDSREEQEFLEQSLRGKMTMDEDKFWIGLTDSAEENKWLWVDDSPLSQSLSFWSVAEPDNWSGEDSGGENCVRMGERAGAEDMNCWFDKSCTEPHRWICEKRAETEQTKCV